MRAHCGIWNVCEQEIAPTAVRKLTASMELIGGETRTVTSHRHIAMAYRDTRIARDQRFYCQPHRNKRGRMLTWDGRLDNRDELALHIGEETEPSPKSMASAKESGIVRSNHDSGKLTHAEQVRSLPDTAYVMAAYQRWGGGFLERIIGDFALALWDPDRKTLILARDAFGTRPLFYYRSGMLVLWSSELRTFFAFGASSARLDDEYVAGHLVMDPPPDRTPYKDINVVPPGCMVVINGGGPQTRRFWNLDLSRTASYQQDSEYEEHFRELFYEAVRCRLQVEGPVFAELSGGVDSTSVVCMGDKVLAEGKGSASSINTVSIRFKEARNSDEGKYIKCVENWRHKAGHEIFEDDYPMLSFELERQALLTPNPLWCWQKVYQRVSKLMQSSGAHTLLRGLGGDHVMWAETHASPQLSDLICQGRIATFHWNLLRWARLREESYVHLLRASVLHALPPHVQTKLRSRGQALPPWVGRKLVDHINLSVDGFKDNQVFRHLLPSRRAHYRFLLDAIAYVSACYYRQYVCADVVYPLLHKPLVEYCMTVPFDQMQRPTQDRSLMRRALRDLLPKMIVDRTSKGDASEAFLRAFMRESLAIERIFSSAYVCAHGYVDAKALAAAVNSAQHGKLLYTECLARVITLELWLRANDRSVLG